VVTGDMVFQVMQDNAAMAWRFLGKALALLGTRGAGRGCDAGNPLCGHRKDSATPGRWNPWKRCSAGELTVGEMGERGLSGSCQGNCD
jgi:hypothetical protein